MTPQEIAASRDGARDYWLLIAMEAENVGPAVVRLGTIMARLRAANGDEVNLSGRPRVPAQRGE